MGRKLGVDEEDFWRLDDAAAVSIVGLRREEDHTSSAPVNLTVNVLVPVLLPQLFVFLSGLHSSHFSGYNSVQSFIERGLNLLRKCLNTIFERHF